MRLNLKRKWKGKVRRTRKGLEARRPLRQGSSGQSLEPKVVKHKWGEVEPDQKRNTWVGAEFVRQNGSKSALRRDGVPSSGVDTVQACLSVMKDESDSSKPATKAQKPKHTSKRQGLVENAPLCGGHQLPCKLMRVKKRDTGTALCGDGAFDSVHEELCDDVFCRQLREILFCMCPTTSATM